MRILYHHRTLGDGAEGIHIRAIADGLSEQGHQVKIVSVVGEKTQFRSSQYAKEIKWDKIKSYIPGPLYELAEIMYNVKGIRMLSRKINTFKPDFIYDRYAHHSFAGVWCSKRFNIPLILEVNSPYSIQKTKWEKTYFPGVSKMGERRILHAAPHILVVSTPLKEIVMNYGVADEHITVLPNGTDPDKFTPNIDSGELRRQLGLEGKLVLGFVGILRSWHNIYKLIHSLEEIDLKRLNAVMLFLGDGPSFKEFFTYNRDRGHEDTIKFLGRIPHSEIHRYISIFDIAISPHATFYSSPMKILEYMAMEKAILAPDMKNIRDLVEDGETATLFEPDNAASLKEKLLLLLGSAALRKKLGKKARQRVLGQYTWSNNARKTVEIAQVLIAQKRKQKI